MDDLRVGIEGLEDAGHLSQFLGTQQVDLVDDEDVCELDLIHQQVNHAPIIGVVAGLAPVGEGFRGAVVAEEIQRIDDGHQGVESCDVGQAAPVFIGEGKRLGDGKRFGDAGAFDDEDIEAVGARQGGHFLEQVFAERATDAAIRHFHELFLGAIELRATPFHQCRIDVDLAHVIDDERHPQTVAVVENVVKQGGLAGAEKAGKDCHRQFVPGFSHGWMEAALRLRCRYSFMDSGAGIMTLARRTTVGAGQQPIFVRCDRKGPSRRWVNHSSGVGRPDAWPRGMIDGEPHQGQPRRCANEMANVPYREAAADIWSDGREDRCKPRINGGWAIGLEGDSGGRRWCPAWKWRAIRRDPGSRSVSCAPGPRLNAGFQVWRRGVCGLHRALGDGEDDAIDGIAIVVVVPKMMKGGENDGPVEQEKNAQDQAGEQGSARTQIEWVSAQLQFVCILELGRRGAKEFIGKEKEFRWDPRKNEVGADFRGHFAPMSRSRNRCVASH